MISVIVPVYGVEEYIGQCIESLINQTYRNLEIILVDDGSKDKSGAICDEYAKQDSRIRVLHKDNGGLPSARNAGLEAATGEWIMHVDGDDWIEPKMIESLISAVDESSVDIVIGGLHFVYECEPSKNKEVLPIEWHYNKIDFLQRYLQSSWTCLCGTMARRSLYTEYGLKSPEGITWQEDFFLIIRLLIFSHDIRTVSNAYYNYRQRSSSIMNSWTNQTVLSGKRVIESTLIFFGENNVPKSLERCLIWRWFNIMQGKIFDPDFFQEIHAFSAKNRNLIIDCPFLTAKRKLLYLMHSIGLSKIINLLGKR